MLKKNSIINKVQDAKHKVLAETEEFKASDLGELRRNSTLKSSIYVSGSKTHPQFFDEMTPELISAMDRPLLKSKSADYIAFLNLKDK